MLEEMQKRVQNIQDEIKKTKETISALSEQLKVSKNQLQQLLGHFNEANHWLNNYQELTSENQNNNEANDEKNG